MPAQRDLAFIGDGTKDLILSIQVGNANIGVSTVKVNDRQVKNPGREGGEFDDSFQVNLGPGIDLKGREVAVSAELAPNPAIQDKTLLLSYDIPGAKFFTNKNKTLTSMTYNGSDSFRVTITLF